MDFLFFIKTSLALTAFFGVFLLSLILIMENNFHDLQQSHLNNHFMKRKLHCPRAVAKAVIKGVALTLLPFFAFAYSPMSPTSFGKYAKAHPISQLDVRVSGTVVGPNGEPIPGVTVSLEGASIGTATDLDGRYALRSEERRVGKECRSRCGPCYQEI